MSSKAAFNSHARSTRLRVARALRALLAAVAVCVPSLAVPDPALAADLSPAANVATRAHRVYVTNEMSGDLTVIDGLSSRVIATVKLGKRPRGLKLAPSGKFLFVALSGSPIMPPGADERKAPPADKSADGIGVVDTASLRLIRVVRGVSDPEQLAVSADGSRLFVASEDAGLLKVIDVKSDRVVATLSVGGEPEGVTLSPNGRFVYVTSEEDSIVSVIDTDRNSIVKTLKVGKRPRFCDFSRDGARAYCSGELDASISVIDARAHTVIGTIRLEGENVRPMGIAVAPDGKTIYVATGRGGTIASIDTQSLKTLKSVTVGPRPWNVALSSDGAVLYSANGTSNDISVVDSKTMSVLRKIAVGERPWGVVVDDAVKSVR
jgi:YVTN family beta-propeller protein